MNFVQKKAAGIFLKKFYAEGMRTVLITLKEAGDFDLQYLTDNDIVVKKDEYDFLKNFFNKNKNML